MTPVFGRRNSRRIEKTMANKSKDKGDRYERAAVKYIIDAVPGLVDAKTPMRLLGAGRKDDVGDLNLFTDAAIQVKAVANMGQAVRSAVEGSVVQASNAKVEFALGMVPVQGARKTGVNWLACTAVDRWPLPVEPVAEFSLISKALDWLRDDVGPYGYRVWPRAERICLLGGPGTPCLVAPFSAWLDAFALARELKDPGLAAAA